MSEAERCPVCGDIKATTLDQLSESGYCWRSYEYCSKTNPYRHTIARLQSERDLLATEVEAWRALAGCRGLLHRGDDGYWFEVFGKVATLEMYPTPQAAAVAACTKLGLLPAPKEST